MEAGPKKNKRPSSRTWIIVHVVFPLIPFFLAGSIKFVVKGYEIDYSTFGASTLAMSIGLLCVLVNQSLLTTKLPLMNSEEYENIRGTATMFFILAIAAFAYFGILVAFGALIELKSIPEVEKARRGFEILTFILSGIPIFCAIKTQKCYKLKATI